MYIPVFRILGKLRVVAIPIEDIVLCHCRNCQKSSGAGASANSPVPSEKFELTSGEPKLYADTADSGNTPYRAFCVDCGSSLYSKREQMPERSMLKVGSLDDSSGAQVIMNLWTDSAWPWTSIDPDLPAHDQNRPA